MPTDLSDAAASWLVIWSAIGMEAAYCGIVLDTSNAVRALSTCTLSAMRRQRWLFVPVRGAVWGAQARCDSCVREGEQTGGRGVRVRGGRRVPGEQRQLSLYRVGWWGNCRLVVTMDVTQRKRASARVDYVLSSSAQKRAA